MNNKTKKIVDFIDSNEKYINKILELKQKYSNSKDFFENLIKYVVMDILNSNKEFYDYPRSQIELDEIIRRYSA